MFIKLLIVASTAMIVTFVMEANGYSLTSQTVAAGLIGALLGIVDTANGKKD